MPPLTFARWLKQLRAAQDLTQEKLSEYVGCATPTLRSFEIGLRRPSREMAERIADVFKMPTDQRAEFVRLARLPIQSDDAAEPKATTADPAAAHPIPPANPALPPLPNQMIGREAEHNALLHLLCEDRHRLVTLVGGGGMGKTRLALEIAHHLGDQRPNGTRFVALAPLQSAQHLGPTLVAALGIETSGAQSHDEAVLTWLADKEMLLVLDNFEQLLHEPAAIDWVKTLLRRTSSVQLLITSRERLRISGERIFELGGLGHSGSQPAHPHESDAMLLFLARAEQIAGDFVLDSSNRQAVALICDLAQGMPLAIELAAAWVRTLSPAEIAEEIKRNFDFLALADRDASPRHRSMRAVFDHSWKLLGDEEQQALMKLSLFRSGCSRQAAEAVAGATLPILASLIDKSLIYRTTAGAAARFFLHELIGQYAAEHLQTQPFAAASEDQFANYFVTLIESLAPKIEIDDSFRWRRLITSEQDNLRRILQRSLTERRNPDLGLRLVVALGPYWCNSDVWKEGRDWLVQALSLAPQTGVLRAQALTSLGELVHLLGDQPKAEQILADALQRWRALDDPTNTAWTLLQLGKAASTHGAYAEADVYLTESLAIYRQLGNGQRIATLLAQLSAIAVERGDYGRAAALLEESLPGVRAANRARPLAVALNFYGRSLLGQGDAARALPLFEEALALFETEEAESGVAWALINLGLTHYTMQNWQAAAATYRRALLIYYKLERLGGMMAALEGLAAVAAAVGEAEKCVQLLAAAATLHKQSGQTLSLYELEIQQKTLATSRTRLDEQIWQHAWQRGQTLTLAQMVSLAQATFPASVTPL